MDVLIIGAGGHGKVVLDILRRAGEHTPVGFLDADPTLAGREISGVPVLGSIHLLGKLKSKAAGAIIAIGDNRTRLSYAQKMQSSGWTLVRAIHPSAVVAASAQVGINVVVAAGAVIGVDSTVTDSAIINTCAVVDHECTIGSAAHICPGALLAGRVTVGEGAFVGLGSRVIQCLAIGAWSTVGAGAVCTREVPAGATVVGVPARVIKVTTAVA